MNTIRFSDDPMDARYQFQGGDLIRNNMDHVYLLATVGATTIGDPIYCAVSLHSGQRWNESSSINPAKALEGMKIKQVLRDAAITVSIP